MLLKVLNFMHASAVTRACRVGIVVYRNVFANTSTVYIVSNDILRCVIAIIVWVNRQISVINSLKLHSMTESMF